MGNNPIPAEPIRRARSREDELKERYVEGALTIDEFEQALEQLLISRNLSALDPTNDYQIFSQFPSPRMEEIAR